MHAVSDNELFSVQTSKRITVCQHVNMEGKLAAYRAKKVKEKEAKHSLLNRLKGYLRQQPKNENSPTPSQAGIETMPHEAAGGQLNVSNNELRERIHKAETETRNDSLENECRNSEAVDYVVKSESQSSEKWWMFLFLKFLLWLCIWGIFIELEFGAVYFTVSLLLFIYFNTRTGQKDENKPSAYSVFNKDFEKIQGTVTAEQLQQNMFRIPGVSA